jgi:methylated-DNA-[protein]-cysteine S-methyltransferase
LLQIAPGSTCRYGDIAAALGQPAAARAVGAAVGRNPVGILVPCHRVIGANGALTGYAGGLPRKRALLAHEALRPWAEAEGTDATGETGETGESGGAGEGADAAATAEAAASPARRAMAA